MIVLELSKSVYSLLSVKSVAHRLSAEATCIIDDSDKFWILGLRPNLGLTNLDDLACRATRELLDQELRQILDEKTQAFRSVIIAQAFSGVNLLHPELDSAPAGTDPLGLSKPDSETGRIH